MSLLQIVGSIHLWSTRNLFKVPPHNPPVYPSFVIRKLTYHGAAVDSKSVPILAFR